MKRTSTLLEMFKKSFLLLFCFTAITLFNAKLYGQAKERVYATSQTKTTTGLCLFCNIATPGNAVDGKPSTKSTINLPLGALGSTISQDLTFSNVNLPAGTEVVIKIGTGERLLTANLLGGVKIQALNAAGIPVGPVIDGNSGLLTLLALGNQTEIFISPGAPFSGIRVKLDGGALTAAASIDVYDAYYLRNATNINCDAPIDELHGISGNIAGLGGVADPLYAIDASESTYSILQAAVGVLGYTQQTIIFPGLSAATDSVRMVISTTDALVSLQLLNSVSIETFNGQTSNDVINGTSGLLNVRLLSPGGKIAVLTFAPGKAFDRVQLRMGGVANVLKAINLHAVSRSMALPTTININSIPSASGIACLGDGITLSINAPEANATYTWYTEAIGGTGTQGVSITPTGLATGTHDFYVTGKRADCTNETSRKLVRVVVSNPIVPIVATPNPICSGGKVTLAVNAPVSGQTYKWYELETGGTAVATGVNFLTPVLAANKSYYVESVIGSCASTRTKVDITVNPTPADATVAIPNVEITKGQTATLTASAEVGSTGNTVKWFTAANGGVAVYTGSVFKTPTLNATTIYYVEIQNTGGCVSAKRVPVTVTVTDIDPGSVCNVPNAQGSGVEGLLCVLCGVENGANAINSDPTKFSSLRLTLGVGGQVYQRLFFPSAGAATDSIRLDVAIPGGLTDVSLLGGVTINVLNNGAVVKTYNLNSGLLHLSLLSGNRFKATIPAGAAFNAVEIRLGAVVTALTTVDVYGATIIYPNPTLPAGGFNICSGSTATLTATPIGTTTLKWFDSLTGGTELASGNTFSPAGLTASTIYFIEVSKGTCINTERFPVTVNVNPTINFAASALTNATIGSAYSKQITLATGGTPGFTYKVATGSNVPAGLTLSTDGTIGGTPTAASGDYSFTITATDSKGCSVDATYNLKVTDGMNLPDMTLPNGTVNIPYPTQVIPEATGGTTPYTYTATNLPPGLNFDPVTREITGTPTEKGIFPVHVTATDSNGNSVTNDYIIVVRDPLVLPPTTLANGTVNIPYPTQTIPAATGGSGSYTYTASNLPPGLHFDPATREIKGTPTQVGTFTIPVKVTDTDGNTVTTNYTIVVGDPLLLAAKPLADGTVGIVYATETIPSATGGDGNYTYVATNLPPGLTFDPATRTISGTPTNSGSYNVSVKVTDGAGATATQVYVVKVNGELNLPSATLPDGLVGAVYPTQTLPEVTGGTSPYTYSLDGLPPALTFDPATREIKGTPLTGGTYTLTMTATDKNGITTSTDYTLVVNVGDPIVAAVTSCSGSTATLTVSNAQPGVTYNWYASTGSTSIYTGPTFTTAALNANTTYYVQAVSGTALSNKTQVIVTINPAPDVATVISANESISAGQSARLLVSTTAGNTIKWYTTATGGASFFTGESYTTPALNMTTTYYVETENALGCVSATRAAIVVTVSNGPANPNCNVAVGQETGIDGVCLLCSVVGPGNSTDDNPNNFTKINLTVGVGATGYQRLIFAGAGVATDSIRLDLATPVGLADVSVLGGITVRVMNGNTVVSTYNLDNALIDLKLLGGTRFKATLPAGGVYDRVEVRFGALVAALSNLSIYGAEVIYPNPTVATSGKLICAGSGTTLTATANGGTTLKWYDTATGGTALATGETFTIAGPLTNNTTYYIEVSKNGCANVQRIPVIVEVTTAPGVPTLAASAEVCAGSSAVLPVNNPVTGTTYKWYTSSTGGTSIFEGAVFTTPALSANITYYVEAANGTCVSASRAAVAVKVNPLPILPQVQVSSNTVGLGQSAILNATSTESNVIFNWYSTANATTPIYTGPTYVTSPLMVTTTYYLEAVSTVTGCAASSRVQITINVDGSGTPNPVPCEAASTQTKGVDGIAVVADVFNPELAIDDDTKTGSSLVLPVGLLGGSVYQRVGFVGLSTVGDTVRIKLTAPGKLLSVGVLSGITLTTYNGVSSNNDEISLNNALINLELLSGNTEALLSFVPGQTFDRVEVRLNAGIAGVLTTVDLNYAQRVMVAPTVTSAVVNLCATQTTTLSVANSSLLLTYKWYDNTGAYIAGKDGTSFVTDALTADTKYYVAASNAAGCISYKSLIEVKVSAAPAIPELESPIVTTCANNDVVLRVKNPVAGIIYQWFDGADTYLAGKDGTTLQVTVGVTDEMYTVKAFDSNCGVTSAAATATIKVGNLDAPIITPPSMTVKVGSPAVLTATSSTADVIFSWYDAPTNGTLLHTGPTYMTTPQATPGVITYYVEGAIVGGCATIGRTAVTVTTIPNDGATGVPCEAATKETNGKEGLAVLANVYNAGLAIDDDASTASSLVIPVGLLGGSVYQQLGFKGISNLGDTVRILLSSPGKVLSLSVLPSLEISTFKNGASNNDVTIINNPLINLELLSGGTQALLTFVPTSTFDAVQVKLNSGLVGAFSSIDVNYAQRVMVAPTVAAKTATACEGASATLSINNPLSDVVYRWYQGTTFQAEGTTFNTPAGLSAGTYDFFVTAARNGCESVRVKVVVTIMPVPAPPVADTNNLTSTCINTPVTLKIIPVSGVVYNWYNAAVGGTQLVANNTSYTTPANLAANTYNYYVEAVNTNSCANATRTKITLIVKANAVATDIIALDQAICAGSTAKLTATAPSIAGATFKWYTTPALTDTPVDGDSFITPALTTTTKYYVIVSGTDICANDASSAKVVTVTVNRNAIATDIVAADKTVCSGSATNLTASTTKVTNPVFSWYKNADLSDVPFVGANFTTDVLTANTKYYVTVSGSDACANDAASAKIVTVTVNRNATATDINAADRSTCFGTAVTLTASTTVINPVFSWYKNADLSDAPFVGANFTTGVLTANTKYYVTVSGSDVCANDAASAKVVTVTVNRNATASDIDLQDQTICAGTTAVLSASSTTVNSPVFRWYSDASLTEFVFQGPTFTTPALTLTTKYYVKVSGTNACANDVASAKVVTVTVTRNAGVTDIIADDKTICAGTNTQLTASSGTVANPVFTWYHDAALTNVAHVGDNMAVSGLTATKKFYVTITGDGVCANLPGSAKVVTVTVNPLPNVPIFSTTGTAICSGNITVLTIQNPQAGVVYDWYTASTGGNLVNTGISFTTGILNANVDYFVQATNTTGCGSIAGRAKVSVVVTSRPQTPSVVSGTINTCMGSTATLSVSGAVSGITYNWYATAISNIKLGSGTQFTTPATTAAITTYYVEAESVNCVSTSRTPVVVNAGAIPLPPPSVSGAGSPICQGSTAVLTVNNPDLALKYTWYTSAVGGTGTDGTTFNVPALNATTIYYVGSSNIANGCVSASRTPITVTVLGKLDAPVVSAQSVTATSITFGWPAVTGATAYEVSVDNGLNWIAPSSGAAGITHTISGLQPDQKVTIKVRAKGQLACQLSDATTFTVTSENPIGNDLFVPNTFTPNNDGQNDVLYVYGNTIAKMQLRVYSQWGQFIYESLNIQNGWDGTYKGQMQPNGVYVYYLEVEFNDGTKATKKGTITLLR